MRTRKITPVILLAFSTLFFTQCEVYREGCMDPNATNYDVAADIDDGSCIFIIDPNQEVCQADIEGNLSITNQTGELLFLYANNEYKQCIPADAENFIVNIPNQENNVFTLKVWKSGDINNKDNPDITKVYRQWSVALSSNTLPAERANWIITNSDANSSSGTLSLSYPNLDEYNQQVIYQVDVMLNSKNGSKLASLQPGASDKKVSIDYGIHFLYFRYWYSDPNSTTGEIIEIGWNEANNIVINAEHKTADIDIPVFYSIVGKYGYTRIFNKTTNPVTIYANDKLIEQIAKVDGSTNGLSIIPAFNSTLFLIPEETYTISAKSVDGTTSIGSFKGMHIVTHDTAKLAIGPKYKDISFTNNTTEPLMLYSEGGEYLGMLVEPGASSGIFLVESGYDTLVVFNPSKTKTQRIGATTGVIVSTLNDHEATMLNISTPWTLVVSNHYQSPDINDNETTNMLATLFNTNDLNLSFEYKVSSEYGYDKFYFLLDGVILLNGESGVIDWKYFYSTSIAPGNHTLEWRYVKDAMFSRENDNVEIRNITAN